MPEGPDEASRIVATWGDLLPEQTTDDVDDTWQSVEDGDVARLLGEKPPHHVD